MTAKRRQKRKANPIVRLYRLFKLTAFLCIIAAIGYGFWYSKQDESTQRHAQEKLLAGLDWPRNETPKEL
jgi:hypothetical protein